MRGKKKLRTGERRRDEFGKEEEMKREAEKEDDGD